MNKAPLGPEEYYVGGEQGEKRKVEVELRRSMEKKSGDNMRRRRKKSRGREGHSGKAQDHGEVVTYKTDVKRTERNHGGNWTLQGSHWKESHRGARNRRRRCGCPGGSLIQEAWNKR